MERHFPNRILIILNGRKTFEGGSGKGDTKSGIVDKRGVRDNAKRKAQVCSGAVVQGF